MQNKSHLISLFILISLAGCSNHEKPESTANENETYCLDSGFKERIAFVRPAYGKVTEAIHLTGSVEANPDRVVSFVSLVSGVVTNVGFSIGDRVQKGQVLAELRSAELSALQSELSGLRSKIEVAERRLKSVKSMYDDGVSSEKDLLEARSDLDVLQSELARTTSDLSLYSAGPSDGIFRIKAPATGIITQKALTPGEQVSPGSGPLFTVSDLSRIWILANVHATNVKDVSEGMEVGITTLSYPDEKFPGRITAISSVMDEEAKVLKARIEMPNHDMKLKPGMLVDINAFKPSDRTALSLPTSSIVFDDNQNYVVLYKDDCLLTIRKVEIIARNNGTTYLSDGPDSTETVVSQNQLLIFEQLKNFQN